MSNFFHKTLDGTLMPLQELTDNHLANIIQKLLKDHNTPDKGRLSLAETDFLRYVEEYKRRDLYVDWAREMYATLPEGMSQVDMLFERGITPETRDMYYYLD